MKRETIFVTAALLMGGALVANYLRRNAKPLAAVVATPDASTAPSTSALADPDAANATAEPRNDAADENSVTDVRCTHITEANGKKLELVMSAHPECKFDREPLERLLRVCHTTPEKLWALSLDDVGIEGCGELWATLALVHDDAKSGLISKVISSNVSAHVKLDGGRERIVNFSIQTSGWGAIDMEEPTFFDFDGNGDPEVMLGGQVDEEGYNPSFFQVIGFADGAIGPYAPAKPFDAVDAKDEDDDGRPDLATRGPYAVIKAESCVGDSWPIVSPLLIARSLPDGTFSMAGAGAAAIAKKSCPAKPTALVARGSSGWVDESSADAIVCFRLWGKTRDDAIKALKGECASFYPDGAQCGRGTVDEHGCPKWVLDVAAIEPPLHLR